MFAVPAVGLISIHKIDDYVDNLFLLMKILCKMSIRFDMFDGLFIAPLKIISMASPSIRPVAHLCRNNAQFVSQFSEDHPL